MQIILKRSRLRAQPRLLKGTKKACAVTNGGFLIKHSTSHQREPTREPLAAMFIVYGIEVSHGLYVIQLRLRIRAYARVGSLASVPWPEHTSPKCTQATELNCT